MKYPNTKKALEIYDLESLDNEVLFNKIEDDHNFNLWDEAWTKSLNKVRLAFYEDTKEYNSLNNCMCVGIEWLRALI